MARLGFGRVIKGLVVLGMLGIIPLFPGNQGLDIALAQVGVRPSKTAHRLAHFLDLRVLAQTQQSWAFQCDMTGAKTGQRIWPKNGVFGQPRSVWGRR